MNNTQSLKIKVRVGVSVLIFTMSFLAFQNCSGPEDTQVAKGGSETLAPINYFTSPRPESLCGKAGFAYLHQQYFAKNCGGGCHVVGGFIGPAFADPDINVAYSEQQFVKSDRILMTSIKNQFCGPYCNLDTHGEVYEGILEWLGCR